VTIINGEIDPLWDDGAQLEQALKAANVAVERRLCDGVVHAGSRLPSAFGT
jgi:acetyl esterase/lipase